MSNQISLTKKVINAVTQGRGLRGYSIIIDVSDAGMIQWRQDYTGAPWNDIIALADLIGPQGDAAPNTVFQYSVNGTDWTDVATGAQWYRQSGDNGTTWSEAIAIFNTAYADAKVSQTITNGVTTTAPSEDAVFDALALKADITDVDDALALKADTADVADALALKADLTYVEYLMMEGDPA